MGNPESGFSGDVAECARVHMIEMQRLPAQELRRRYPAFQIPDEYVACSIPQRAGLMYTPRCCNRAAKRNCWARGDSFAFASTRLEGDKGIGDRANRRWRISGFRV